MHPAIPDLMERRNLPALLRSPSVQKSAMIQQEKGLVPHPPPSSTRCWPVHHWRVRSLTGKFGTWHADLSLFAARGAVRDPHGALGTPHRPPELFCIATLISHARGLEARQARD